MEYSENILKVLKERGITPYRVFKKTGIPQTVFSEWKRKPTSNIYACNLVKIADFLGCSVDYLLGRTDAPEVNGGQSAGAPGPEGPAGGVGRPPRPQGGAGDSEASPAPPLRQCP